MHNRCFKWTFLDCTWQKRCPSSSLWTRPERWHLTTKWESSNMVLNQRLVGSSAWKPVRQQKFVQPADRYALIHITSHDSIQINDSKKKEGGKRAFCVVELAGSKKKRKNVIYGINFKAIFQEKSTVKYGTWYCLKRQQTKQWTIILFSENSAKTKSATSDTSTLGEHVPLQQPPSLI